MFLHFRPSLKALGEAERDIRNHPAADDLVPTADYISVVELGLYSLTKTLLDEASEKGVETGSAGWQAMVDAALVEEGAKRYTQSRLHPRQPEEMPYVCFYPMDKRRTVGQNWYSLPLAERAALMADHGNTGRRYAGRISQIISGSMGLDDWEWGVTLFATNPLDLKAIVAEMRFDEVSAIYAEFGSFWVGHRVATDRIAAELTG
jgi:chlorite dismutase